MAVVDEDEQVRYPSLASTLVQNRLRQQSLAEELRVLYVAMTRGTGAPGADRHVRRGQPDRWAARWAGHAGPLPADAVLGGAEHARLDRPRRRRHATGRDAPTSPATTSADVLAWQTPDRYERPRRRAAGELAGSSRSTPRRRDPPGRRGSRPAVDYTLPVRAVDRKSPPRRPMTEAGGRKAAGALAKSRRSPAAAPRRRRSRRRRRTRSCSTWIFDGRGHGIDRERR